MTRSTRSLMSRSHSWQAAAAGVLALTAPLITCASANAQATSAPASPSTAEAAQVWQDLDAELAAAQAEVTALRAQHTAADQAATEALSNLAQTLLSRRLDLQQERLRLERLEADQAGQQLAARGWSRATTALWQAGLDAAERLQLHLLEIPGSETARAALPGIQQALRAAIERGPEADLEPAATALIDLTALLDAAHAQATRPSLQRTALHTASGALETVDLLLLGHARFAYLTPDGRRGALALASPARAEGYRWSEALPAGAVAQLRAAAGVLAAPAAEQTQVLAFPADPTGSLSPDALVHRNTLMDHFRAGGPVMYPLTGVALLALLLILERFVALYGRQRQAGAVAERILADAQAGRYDSANALGRSAGGAPGRVLAACLSRRTGGQRAMEDSIQEQLLHEAPPLSRFMGGIALLAGVAPLLGLLGTVTGIIQTFAVIRAFGNADATLMAGGISEALITTAAGLIIAIPILLAHALLRGRAEAVLANAERHAARLLMLLAHDVPGLPAPVAPTVAPPTPPTAPTTEVPA